MPAVFTSPKSAGSINYINKSVEMYDAWWSVKRVYINKSEEIYVALMLDDMFSIIYKNKFDEICVALTLDDLFKMKYVLHWFLMIGSMLCTKINLKKYM